MNWYKESNTSDWWDLPSDNPYARGMTRGEVILDWLKRHDVPQENGKFVFYHATPVVGGATDNIRAGSYLAEDPETAKQQASRDRGAKAGEIKVIKVLVRPDEINTGVWPTLRNDYIVDKI